MSPTCAILLEPCRCGRTPKYIHTAALRPAEPGHVYLVCECGIETRLCKTENEAAEIWNRAFGPK